MRNVFDQLKQMNPLVSKEMKAFNNLTQVYELCCPAGKYHYFKGKIDKENKIIYVPYDKYIFKKNDNIIDESDLGHFVTDVESKHLLPLNIDGNESEITVQKIEYKETPIQMPTYLSQLQNIQSNININAANSALSNFGNICASQSITYQQILNDLEQAVKQCYNGEKLLEMIKEMKELSNDKKPYTESNLKKFLKLMGTQIKNLAECFVSAYAFGLAVK